MDYQEALAIVVDKASRWGENAEEDFPDRLVAETTDKECLDAAEKSGGDVEQAIEIRDLWRAIDVLHGDKTEFEVGAPSLNHVRSALEKSGYGHDDIMAAFFAKMTDQGKEMHLIVIRAEGGLDSGHVYIDADGRAEF